MRRRSNSRDVGSRDEKAKRKKKSETRSTAAPAWPTFGVAGAPGAFGGLGGWNPHASSVLAGAHAKDAKQKKKKKKKKKKRKRGSSASSSSSSSLSVPGQGLAAMQMQAWRQAWLGMWPQMAGQMWAGGAGWPNPNTAASVTGGVGGCASSSANGGCAGGSANGGADPPPWHGAPPASNGVPPSQQPVAPVIQGSPGLGGDDGRRQQQLPKDIPIFLDPGVEELVAVPKALIGRVVGKRGATIAEVRQKSGCWKVDAHDQSSDPVQVKVAGTAEAVKKARELIKELAEDLKIKHAESEFVEISQGRIGRVIGIKGAMVNEIEVMTRTKIDIDYEREPCRVYIVGKPEDISKAKEVLLGIAKDVEK